MRRFHRRLERKLAGPIFFAYRTRRTAEIRSRVRGPVDAVAVVREGREELEQRGMDKR